MSLQTDKLVTDALRLPREERALLAEKLLESLDHDEPFDVSPEWREEIRRRSREMDEGKQSLVPGDKVFDDIRDALG